MLLQASERRLTRLGYDLHDGPLQELLLVGEDLSLFRTQLAVVLEGLSAGAMCWAIFLTALWVPLPK